MKYNLAGPTFDFVFNGHKLDSNTEYSLIYYADPWPGNHPGKLIATGTPKAGGNLHLKGPVELNMDLPHSDDGDYPDGAKIWLIPSDAYDANTCSVTSWPADPDRPPDGWLFEYDPITYNDTDV